MRKSIKIWKSIFLDMIMKMEKNVESALSNHHKLMRNIYFMTGEYILNKVLGKIKMLKRIWLC